MPRTLALLLIVVFPVALHAQATQQTFKDIEALRAFYPRPEGSVAEKQALAYVVARLREEGLAFSTFDFSQSDFTHSYSSCIRVDVPGAMKDTVIVAVPMNTDSVASSAKDQSVDMALALDLLHHLAQSRPLVSVIVLFLGAEFGDGPDYPLGSRLFLSDFRPDYQVAFVYLNLKSLPSRIVVRGGGKGIIAPYWLMDKVVTSLDQAGVPYVLRGEESQVYRLGLAGESTLIDPYLQAGYPAVSLEQDAEDGPPINPAAWLASFSTFMSSLLQSDSRGLPQEWDRHYLLFQEANRSLIIGERTYIITMLVVLGGVLLYSLVFRKGLKKYIRTLGRNFWSIVPIFAISFLVLVAGTYAVKGILDFRSFQTLWSYAPLTFLLLKLAVSLLLFSGFYGLLRKLPFPRNGSFYSAAAVLFLLIDIVVVAAINVSFSFYFLWAFIFVLAATMVRNRWAKFFLFLPAAFWGVRGLVKIFLMPALPFCRVILLSPWMGNLLIAGALLPFVLFIIRLNLIYRGAGLLRRRRRTGVLAVFFGAVSVELAAALLLISPFNAQRPQPLSVTQVLDDTTRTNRVTMESPAPIGEVTVTLPSGTDAMNVQSTSYTLLLSPSPPPLATSVSETEFLQKKNVAISVTTARSPRSLNAKLTSDQDFVLLDSSVPYVRVSGSEYSLLIRAFPPNPLPLELTLPAATTFTVTLTVEMDSPLIGVEIQPKVARMETHLHIVKSLVFGT